MILQPQRCSEEAGSITGKKHLSIGMVAINSREIWFEKLFSFVLPQLEVSS